MKPTYFFSIFFMLLVMYMPGIAQTSTLSLAQKPKGKIPEIFFRWEDSVAHQFKRKGLVWPPENMYLRSFKFDKELEVWVQAKAGSPYQLFKTYKVCMQSGSMGPKRVEGDYQVPEGFYYINEFNPNSAYHLSLGLNYPNASDRILSDERRPGSAIYVHGNCVSTGCIPIRDEGIEELYVLSSQVKMQGHQEFIPIHVFPVRYNVKKSLEYLQTFTDRNEHLKIFNENIRQVFDYFETKKQLPIIMVNQEGKYILN